jgi:hypothetical protein
MWSKVLLVFLSVAFACTLGEVAARLLLQPPARVSSAGYIYETALSERHMSDPEIGWILSSDAIKSKHRVLADDGSLIFDVHYSIEKNQRLTSSQHIAGPLIIATGCSFTFGHGLPDEDTWPWLLQERLPDHRIVNVGCMGYGTDQALLAAERQVLHSAHRVRFVVLGFADFHIGRIRSPQNWLVLIYPFGKPLYLKRGYGLAHKGLVKFYSPGRLLSRSVLASHVSNKVANKLRNVSSSRSVEPREVTARLIQQADTRLRSKGITLVVVMLPWHGDHTARSQADQTFIVERLRAAKVHLLVPDVPRRGNGVTDGRLLWISERDFHPNRTYNVLLADQLSQFLKTNVITVNQES